MFKHGELESPYTVKDLSNKVQSVLGMTFEEFVTAVYLPQKFGHMMIKGGPSERWGYIADIAGCSSLDLLIDRLKSRADDPTATIELETLQAQRSEFDVDESDIDVRELRAGLKEIEASIEVERRKIADIDKRLFEHDKADAYREAAKSLLEGLPECEPTLPDRPSAEVAEDIEEVEHSLEVIEEYNPATKGSERRS